MGRSRPATHSACIVLAASQKPKQQLRNALRNTNRNDERRPAVPILKAPPKQSKNESLQLRVSVDFKLKLQRYAEFLNATPSYVVTEALDRVFRKDHEFRAWLAQHRENSNKVQTENNSTMETTRKS
jgi:predicted transcriptional regulator